MGEEEKKNRIKVLAYLAQGILPFEQWSCVFSNPKYGNEELGLICKAFSVWFPTMIDYISGRGKVQSVIEALESDEDCNVMISQCNKLEEYYKKILSTYSREEQVFLINRRNQNVHGELSQFRIEDIDIKHFSVATQKIIKERISAEDYQIIVNPFYSNLTKSEIELRNRLVTNNELYVEFAKYYERELIIDPYIIEMANDLGIGSDA